MTKNDKIAWLIRLASGPYVRAKATRIIPLMLAVFGALTSGCSFDSDEYTYTLVYDIHWSANYVERKTITSKAHIVLGSYRGTNKVVTAEDGEVEETTAPIRKVSYTKSRKQ